MPEDLVGAGIHWKSLGSLVLLSSAIMGSPGPVTVSLVGAGSTYGVRRSLPYLLGNILGSEIVLFAVATGVTATLLAIPRIGSVLIWISVAYILWLAYHIATAPPLSELTASSPAFSLGAGVLLGVANPKAWVAMAAVFATTRLADGAAIDAAAKLAVLGVMVVVICVTWLIAGTSLAPLLRNSRRNRVVNYGLALALVVATGLASLH